MDLCSPFGKSPSRAEKGFTLRDLRDRTILMVALASGGCRRGEIAGLHTDQRTSGPPFLSGTAPPPPCNPSRPHQDPAVRTGPCRLSHRLAGGGTTRLVTAARGRCSGQSDERCRAGLSTRSRSTQSSSTGRRSPPGSFPVTAISRSRGAASLDQIVLCGLLTPSNSAALDVGGLP